VNSIDELLALLGIMEVKLRAPQDFWGTDSLYVTLAEAVKEKGF
jgi:hypothetical protein